MKEGAWFSHSKIIASKIIAGEQRECTYPEMARALSLGGKRVRRQEQGAVAKHARCWRWGQSAPRGGTARAHLRRLPSARARMAP